MLTAKELLDLDRELTTEEIQAIRVELGMKPQSDVVESTTGEAKAQVVEDALVTHWDIIENLK